MILDSLDMIVNLRDLNAAQTSLFCCTGANLTVRNCTITLINPANQPFTLVRAEGTTTLGSRIRFEKTLIRGAVTSGFDLGKGSVDVAVRETIFLGSRDRSSADSTRNEEATSDSRLSAEFWPAAAQVFNCRRRQVAMHSGSPRRWSYGRSIPFLAGSRGPGSPASSSRKVPLPARVSGLTGWVGRICSAAGRDIMPAAQSKRYAYPASRRSVPRGTAPTRTAAKSWRPGRSRSI